MLLLLSDMQWQYYGTWCASSAHHVGDNNIKLKLKTYFSATVEIYEGGLI